MFAVSGPVAFVLRVYCGVYAMREPRNQALDERPEVSLLVVMMERLAIETIAPWRFPER